MQTSTSVPTSKNPLGAKDRTINTCGIYLGFRSILPPLGFSPTVSIVIPTFKEAAYLESTLANLTAQNFIRNHPADAEVVVADYDPSNDFETQRVARKFGYLNVRYVKVDGSGIGYARHFGIMQSSGRYIINFDADAVFDTPEAIDRILQPLQSGEAQLVWVENEYEEAGWYSVPMWLTQNIVYEVLPISHASGMAFSRDTYFQVGGFPDIPPGRQSVGEDWIISWNITSSYGTASRKKIPGVKVISSARRVMAEVIGFDYSKAYR